MTSVSGDRLPERVQAQYRAHGDPAPATLYMGDSPHVEFDRPQYAIAPGQTVAFYDGDEVLGGAIID